MTRQTSSKRSTRGRPPRSAQQIAAIRAHISGCADRLFREEGYAAISMRRLAKEAGCTPMTLYKYFHSKIDILHELWGQVFDQLFEGLDKVAASENDDAERLYAVAFAYVSYWLLHRDHYFLVFMSSGISQSDVGAFVDDGAAVARFGLLRTCMAEALGTGEGEAEVILKSETLLCALNGITHNLITISAYPWPKSDALVRMAVSGLLST